MDESDDFLDRAVKGYFFSRFLLACLVLGFFIVAGISVVIWWTYTELSLEFFYQHKYGANWQAEYEKYHGTLARAHTQLAICVASMVAIVAVLTWFCRQTFHKHKRHRHKYYET